MKETSDKELKITEERVKAAAEKCGTAKEILKELFPAVFEGKEEWEDVTSECHVETFEPRRGEVSIVFPASRDGAGNHFLDIFPDGTWKMNGIGRGGLVKIENGRIWRKREA